MHPLVAALASVVDAVVGAVQGSPAESVGLSQEEARELLLAVFAQSGRLQVAGARLSTAVDDEGLWALDGARSFGHWLAAATGMPYVKARSVVATGRALRDHLPATLAAGLAGDVSVEQVQTMAIVAATSEARCAALAAPAEDCGEEFLVGHARESGADGFRRLARRWAAAADPACDERGYQDACDREFVALSPTLGGFHLAGFLTTEHGATLGCALDAVMTAPAAGDARTTQQRRAQALVDLSRLVLDHGLVGTGAAVRPHLSVVVDFDTLRRVLEGPHTSDAAVVRAHRGRLADQGHDASGDGAGRGLSEDDGHDASGDQAGSRNPDGDALVEVPFDTAFRAAAERGCLFRLAPVADVERFAVAEVLGAGPIPAGVLARLACDSEVSRIVFGPDSQVINVGRAERTYAGPRRKAVIARDGHCRYPGCTAPPALGEIHHIDQWVRDHGETDINAGILLCWYHHDLIHRLHVEIRPSPGGGWLFLTRRGTPVTAAA
ncbi:MAG: DUF222 domain-containing protein [Cellulomonas sp.]|uniref:HNH endonuclease signature motif containing protein n=1 Tax=Cellulomonas sp. 73-92 TaxID=1895740 RepID=UPI000927BB13|nr:HNH endonuclease signature motif containing protein [Cellulomonas sp. 73-92]MBN9374931.1 DUF222 domain-containing protein [Cellulomonas sp.]OJV80360.1 MAG: hypothetical protein BGO37_03070 [Cellulomonas sp. 73-92]